jgi:hypothetical protein
VPAGYLSWCRSVRQDVGFAVHFYRGRGLIMAAELRTDQLSSQLARRYQLPSRSVPEQSSYFRRKRRRPQPSAMTPLPTQSAVCCCAILPLLRCNRRR